MILKIEISRVHKSQIKQRLEEIMGEMGRAPHKMKDMKKGEWEFIEEEEAKKD